MFYMIDLTNNIMMLKHLYRISLFPKGKED